MIAHLVCALTLVVFYILQTTFIAQTPLLSGYADLILLFLAAWSLQPATKNKWVWSIISGLLISLISAMPFYAPLIGYLGVVVISSLLHSRVWRIPIITMFVATFLGTIFQQLVYVVTLQLNGAPILWSESIDQVILPSILLNLLFAIPIHAVASELAERAYISEEEI
jgi:cell shape-determining protein MreD